MVLPLTVKLSPSATTAVPRPGAAPPVLLSRVAVVMAAGTVALSFSTMPVSAPERPPRVRARARCSRAAGSAGVEHVAEGRGAGEGRGAAQVERGGAGNRGRDVGLGRVADRGLQRLVGDRLGGIDQLGERGDAGVGGLQNLHAVADTVQQVADVAGAAIERLGGEEVGGVVERGIHFLAGREAALRGGEQIGGRLQ